MKIIYRIKSKLSSYGFLFLRKFYYRVIFGKKFPFSAAFEAYIYSKEQRFNKMDIPAVKKVWDQQYQIGKWDSLKNLGEITRYMTIIGYIVRLKPAAAILDAGCGEGILFDLYYPYGYDKYVGFDISSTAVDKLIPEQNIKTLFFCSNIETYSPQDTFDVIIFNEVLYYCTDPANVVLRYAKALRPEGIIIISTYIRSQRAMAILREIKSRYKIVDEVKTINDKHSWVCTVIKHAA